MGEILDIPCGRITPMPGQVREWFDPEKLEELARSIKAGGQRVPALVAKVGVDRYELIDGERRWRAAKIAGVATLRAEVVDEPDPDKRYDMSVVANVGREGNHPMELAVALDRMRRGRTQDQVAALIGKSQEFVQKHLSLLQLHPTLQAALNPKARRGGGLPVSAALKMTSLPHARQIEVWEKIKASRLTPMRAAAMFVEETPERKATLDRRIKSETHVDRLKIFRGHLTRCTQAVERIAPTFPAAMKYSASVKVGEVRVLLRDLIAGATKLLESEEES